MDLKSPPFLGLSSELKSVLNDLAVRFIKLVCHGHLNGTLY